ncbi:Sulfotransfer 1 domain containing protein, partial [Asbolus verrucosus]
MSNAVEPFPYEIHDLDEEIIEKYPGTLRNYFRISKSDRTMYGFLVFRGQILYLVRNPKDVCVSTYLLMNTFTVLGPTVEFETFWEKFKQGLVFTTPYFEHVKEGWKLRNHENVLFLNYDEHTKDMRQTILEVADFLEKKLTDQDLNTLENHLKIENFRKNKAVNNDHLKVIGVMKNSDDGFIRKGKVGGWRDYFKGNLNVEADKWIEENLRNTDLEFIQPADN